MNNNIKQIGNAILIALVVLAIISSVTSLSVVMQKKLLKNTQSIVAMSQAREMSHAIFANAQSVLSRYYLANKNFNIPASVTISPKFIQNGAMRNINIKATLHPLDDKININKLSDPRNQKKFIELSKSVKQDFGGAFAIEMITHINAWTKREGDKANDNGLQGYYESLDVPYRIANYPFVSPSELKLIKGIDDEIYNKIYPALTIVPSPISLKTTSADTETNAYLSIGKTNLMGKSHYFLIYSTITIDHIALNFNCIFNVRVVKNTLISHIVWKNYAAF